VVLPVPKEYKNTAPNSAIYRRDWREWKYRWYMPTCVWARLFWAICAQSQFPARVPYGTWFKLSGKNHSPQHDLLYMWIRMKIEMGMSLGAPLLNQKWVNHMFWCLWKLWVVGSWLYMPDILHLYR
jgi:hypothetical protein